MQVQVEDLSSVKKVLHFEIPEETVAKAVEKAYRDLKKTAKIKGFRPGKVPRAVLERYYRKQVDADVSQKLIEDSYKQAIQENALPVLGNPTIDPPELDYKQPYKFDATIEIPPKLDRIDYKGLPLKRNIYTAGEEEVDFQIEALREKLAEIVPIEEERPAAEGDFVLIDFEGFWEGRPFEMLPKYENYTLKIGTKQLPQPVEHGIIGMNTGESKHIEVSFPPGYPQPALAGKKVVYQVDLHEIRKQVIPEVDDEFARKLGEFETVDALREQIRKDIQEGYDKRSEQELNEQAFNALMEKCDFEIPEALVDYELVHIVQETEKKLTANSQTWEGIGYTVESFAEKYRPVAKAQVKRQLLLGGLIEQEGLAVDETEVEAYYTEIAKGMGQDVAAVKEFYDKTPGAKERLEHALLEKQAIRLILDHSEMETVEGSIVQRAVDDAPAETSPEPSESQTLSA